MESYNEPNILPDWFDGETPILDYLEHFEACAVINNWTERKATHYLAASLRGPALRLLGKNGEAELTYSALTSRLKHHFGPSGKADVFLAELRSRRRKPNETLQELGQSIRYMAGMAYLEFGADRQDKLARGHFLDAIMNPAIREGLFRAQPHTLDEAIEAALNTEAFLQMEAERGELWYSHRHSHSRVLTGSDRPQHPDSPYTSEMVKKMEKALTDLTARLEALTRQVGSTSQYGNTGPHSRGRRQDGPCDDCGQQGHFSWNCPHPKMLYAHDRPEMKEAKTRRCHQCNEAGHFFQNCPHNPAGGDGVATKHPGQDVGGSVTNNDQMKDLRTPWQSIPCEGFERQVVPETASNFGELRKGDESVGPVLQARASATKPSEEERAAGDPPDEDSTNEDALGGTADDILPDEETAGDPPDTLLLVDEATKDPSEAIPTDDEVAGDPPDNSLAADDTDTGLSNDVQTDKEPVDCFPDVDPLAGDALAKDPPGTGLAVGEVINEVSVGGPVRHEVAQDP